jgi:L-alanine-DL-glutamate epimerase-like enolase superfamily enzyme
VRAILPLLAEAGVGWLEEPFPPYDDVSWRAAAAVAAPVLPLAGGESLHTRHEFRRVIEAGVISVVQPDLSRCGITEALRIAALASAAGLDVCTHGCHTGLNMAASVHFLASIGRCARYFEGDGSPDNPLRATLCSDSYTLSRDGTVTPLDGAGLGVAVDEDFLRGHPVTEGQAWQ